LPRAGDNVNLATLPASLIASTLVIPVTGLKEGDRIVGFHLVGQIESGGNVATLDADLRKQTAAAADVTDASLGSMAQISVTADTKVDDQNSAFSMGAPEVVSQDESFYLLVTGTTGVATDVALQAVVVSVIEG
jgi:hypothetical protein